MTSTDKRERIMQAAENSFSSKRFHEITLDEIASEADVGKGTIYTYFKDKEDLFFQVTVSGFEELCRLLTRQVSKKDSFSLQLLQATGAISAFFKKRRRLSGMIHSEEHRMSLCRGRFHKAWFEKRRKLIEAVGKIMQRGQTEGFLRSDLPEEALAGFLLSLLRARAREVHKGKELIDDETIVDIFLNGCAGRATITVNDSLPCPT